MARETTIGWVGSIALHIFVVAILFFIHPPQPESQQQEFVEFSLGGGVASSFGPMPKGDVLPEGTAPPSVSTQGAEPTGVGVDLPLRQNLAPSDEVINMPSTKKTEANDNPVPVVGGTKGAVNEQRETGPTSSTPGFPGGKENVTGKPGVPSGSDAALPFNAGGVGNSIASNISYDIQWSGGRQRDLVSGDLPHYPAGVNVDAQIKLRVVVQPRGTIKSVQPLRKGDTRLENAAIKEVRTWKFESLQQGQPALDQICTITFNFRVK